jgi:hypothetical protein
MRQVRITQGLDAPSATARRRKPTKLSSLGFRVLGKITRDPDRPDDWIIIHDIFGRRMMHIEVGTVYDGRFQRFEDDVPR